MSLRPLEPSVVPCVRASTTRVIVSLVPCVCATNTTLLLHHLYSVTFTRQHQPVSDRETKRINDVFSWHDLQWNIEIKKDNVSGPDIPRHWENRGQLCGAKKTVTGYWGKILSFFFSLSFFLSLEQHRRWIFSRAGKSCLEVVWLSGLKNPNPIRVLSSVGASTIVSQSQSASVHVSVASVIRSEASLSLGNSIFDSTGWDAINRKSTWSCG